MLVRHNLTFNRSAIMQEAWRRTKAKGRFALFHGGFGRFLRDAWAQAKAMRADRAAGGPQLRAREAAEKEARYAAFLKSRTAADLAASDEIIGLLCSTDGRLPLSAIARLRHHPKPQVLLGSQPDFGRREHHPDVSGIGGAHP